MYENLLEELANRGLNWVPGGLESHDWSDSEETRLWIIESSTQIVEGLNHTEPNSYPDVDPRAVILMSQACVVILRTKDGSLSKDLAIIGWLNAEQRGEMDIELELILRGLTARGRAIDCGIFFHNNFLQGQYDTSFVSDIAEVINEGNLSMELLIDNGENIEWADDIAYSRCCGNQAMLMATIVRGVFVQLELGLKIMNSNQIAEFLQIIGPLAATTNLNYAKFSSKDSAIHYSVCHTMMGYMAFIMRNLGGVDFPINSILDSVNKACLDDSELEGVEVYYTLFAHLLRLRILSGSFAGSTQWDLAVVNARNALNNSKKINAYDAYCKIINQIIDGNNVIDLQYYSEQLFGLY
jgi:hypothetical protein